MNLKDVGHKQKLGAPMRLTLFAKTFVYVHKQKQPNFNSNNCLQTSQQQHDGDDVTLLKLLLLESFGAVSPCNGSKLVYLVTSQARTISLIICELKHDPEVEDRNALQTWIRRMTWWWWWWWELLLMWFVNRNIQMFTSYCSWGCKW